MKEYHAAVILVLLSEIVASDAAERHLLDTRQEEGIAWSVVIIAALLVLCYCCFVPILSKQTGEYHSEHLIPENKKEQDAPAGYGSTNV